MTFGRFSKTKEKDSMRMGGVRLPDGWRAALGEVFGPEAVAGVQVRERVWWLQPLPWVVAITGPSRVWLRGRADDFFADPELVLHEYHHVINQWDTRRLSISRYLREWLRVGYWRNAFEVEARAFAAREVGRCRRLLTEARGEASAQDLLALVQAPRDPGEQQAERQRDAG